MIDRDFLRQVLLMLFLMALAAHAHGQGYYGDNNDIYTINQDGNNAPSGLRINRAGKGWFIEHLAPHLVFKYASSSNPTVWGTTKFTFQNDGTFLNTGSIRSTGSITSSSGNSSFLDLTVNGSLVLPNTSGERSIYTWNSGDRNWRIGMNANPGFTRSIVTSHTQFVSYGSGGGQGFAVGENNRNSSFEVRTGDHQAYFRGKVGIGTDWVGGYALNVNGTINATQVLVNGSPLTTAASTWAKSGNDINYTAGKVGVGTTGSWRTLNLPSSGQIAFGNNLAGNSQPGIYWHEGSDYGIYRTSGNWSGPNYQQLKLRWYSGIILEPGEGRFPKSHVGIKGGLSVGGNYYDTKYHDGLIVEGNVGVGTTTPTQKLDVRGTVVADNYIRRDGSAIGGSSTWTKIGDKIFYNGGKVGIGTSDPSVKLDIAGNTYTRGHFSLEGGVGRGIRFWNSDDYKIHMGNSSEYKYGPVTEYSIKMNMNNDSRRGWTWGSHGAQPVMALNTQGNMKTKGYIDANQIRVNGNQVIDAAGNWVGNTAGLQGPKGDKGDRGPVGPAGAQGLAGTTGATGAKGDTGATGAKGDTGATGAKGDKGDTGATGPKGDTGATGAKGDRGLTGAKGDRGLTGATGPRGATGLTGAKGDRGLTGATGPRGATGLTGPKGDRGLTGAKGDRGLTGAKGDKGDTGAKGAKGDTGATGAKGDRGLTGAKGDKGDTGATGAKGDKGDKGEKGDRGPAGPTGNPLWTQNGNRIYYNGGNVGIGTNSPTVKLDVRGGSRFEGNITMQGTVGRGIRFWDSDAYKIHMGNTAEYKMGPVRDYSIKSNMGGGGSRGWTWGSAGVEPVAALNVQGDMKLKGYIDVNELKVKGAPVDLRSFTWPLNGAFDYFQNKSLAANAGNYALLQQNNGTTFLNAAAGRNLHFRINNTDQMIVRPDGKVGIGTTNPAEKLDINGNTYARGDISFQAGVGRGIRFWNNDHFKIHMGNSAEYKMGPVQEYSIKSNMGGGSSARGWTWGTTGQEPVAALNVRGDMKLKGYIDVDELKVKGAPVDLRSFTWPVNRAFDYFQNSALAVIAGNYALKQQNNGTTFLNAAAGRNLYFRINNADQMVVRANGNVGIGTSSPNHKLSVEGDTRVNGNLILPSSAGPERSIYTWRAGDRNWRMGMSSNPGFNRALVTAHSQYITYSGGTTQGFAVGLNGGNSGFEVRGRDHQAFFRGKVGIGTTSVGNYALNVNGTINATDIKVNGADLGVANFGNIETHGTYRNFNTPVSKWGWNYVLGSDGAPNRNSSQWYRFVGSLGKEYGIDQYRLEIAYPRFNQSNSGVWMRTMENGRLQDWVKIGSQWARNGNNISYSGGDVSVDNALQARTMNVINPDENASITFKGGSFQGSVGVQDDGGGVYIRTNNQYRMVVENNGHVNVLGSLSVDNDRVTTQTDLNNLASQLEELEQSQHTVGGQQLSAVSLKVSDGGRFGNKSKSGQNRLLGSGGGLLKFLGGLNDVMPLPDLDNIPNLIKPEDKQGLIFQNVGNAFDISFGNQAGKLLIGSLNDVIGFGPEGDLLSLNNSTRTIRANGDLVLPNATGSERSIYTWHAGDRNWRIGLGDDPGFAMSLLSRHAHFMTYYGGIGQGFAVGANGGNSSLEILGFNHQAFFRGNVGIGTTSVNGYALNVNGTINAKDIKINGASIPLANYGNLDAHRAVRDFNTPISRWGWNYVQGSANAPNQESSQWYRFVGSLGKEYGIDSYRLEIAYPRSNQANAGVWMRTMENGALQDWVQIGSRWSANGGNLSFTGGNVGIGTSSPQAKFHLSSDLGAAGSPRNVDMLISKSGNASGSLDYTAWRTRSGRVSGTGSTTHMSIDLSTSSSPGTDGWSSAIDFVSDRSTNEVNVGIGTSAPRTRLAVAAPANKDAKAAITSGGEYNDATLYLGTPWTGAVTNAYKAAIIAEGHGGGSRSKLHFALNDVASNDKANDAKITDAKMTIDWRNGGRVGIGTVNPSYKLDVAGTVHADAPNAASHALIASGHVHIGKHDGGHIFMSSGNTAPTATDPQGMEDVLLTVEEGIATEDMTYIFADDWDEWPDYVFEEDYKLTSLQELEAFIKRYKHLPGVISQAEVKENGVSDKQMNITLLEKVEELTLYTIEQDKNLKEQATQLQAQQELNVALLKRLAELEAKMSKISER